MHNSWLRELRKSLTRLTNSNTYLKRKNARREFLTNIKDLIKMVDNIYPKLRKDGTEVKKVSIRGYSCPHCRIPLKSIKMLLRHCRRKHNWPAYPNECPCGWQGANLGRHLAAQSDLVVHLGAATLKNAGKSVEMTRVSVLPHISH